MDRRKLAEAADPKALGAYVAQLPAPPHHDHGPGGRIESVREARHAGHHIVIRTTYEITVDGQPLAVPLVLSNDGQLHCHSLPTYQFQSAIGMVKELINTYPEEFRPDGEGGGGGGHGHRHGGEPRRGG